MNFDLNVSNYRKEELVDIFELSNIYNENTIIYKETKLRESIQNNIKIDSETKKKTIEFISKVKNILIEDLNINNSTNRMNTSTSIIKHDLFTDSELKYTNLIDANEHMVQEKNQPNMTKTVIRQNLNIDTRFRDNYSTTYSTNFNFDLPIKISNVINMQLTAIEIPISFYTISNKLGNNYFRIIVGENNNQVIIDNGNYTSSSIITYLNNYMTKLTGTQDISFSNNISSSSNTENGLTIITGSTIFSLDFESNINGIKEPNTDLSLKFGWILGFRNGLYESESKSTTTSYSVTSESILDISGPRYLYLVLDDYNNNIINKFYSAFTSSILNNNILARLSLVYNNAFDIFIQSNLAAVTYPRLYSGPVDLQKMKIQLLDEHGRIVDLNSMDYSFSLTMETLV